MSQMDSLSGIKSITKRLKGISINSRQELDQSRSFLISIVTQPGLDQPSIAIRDPNQRNYLLGGLKPFTRYRVQVRARTVAGLSTSPAMIELTTNISLGKHVMLERCSADKKNQ